MCKINGHFAKKLSTTSQIIGGGSANPFFYIVFTAGGRMYWSMSFRQIEQFEVVGNSTIIFEAPFSTRNA